MHYSVLPSQDFEEHDLLVDDFSARADSKHHQLRTAPVISRDALISGMRSFFPQRGLIGCTKYMAYVLLVHCDVSCSSK